MGAQIRPEVARCVGGSMTSDLNSDGGSRPHSNPEGRDEGRKQRSLRVMTRGGGRGMS